MTKDAEKLLENALALEENERALIAASLIDSLDPGCEAYANESWEREVMNRLKQIESGDTPMVTWTEARRLILKES